MVERIQREIRQEQEKQKRKQEAQRAHMAEVFKENQENRAQKEAEAKRQADEDARQVKAYNKVLDAQEKAREEEKAARVNRQKELMDKMKVGSNKRATESLLGAGRFARVRERRYIFDFGPAIFVWGCGLGAKGEWDCNESAMGLLCERAPIDRTASTEFVHAPEQFLAHESEIVVWNWICPTPRRNGRSRLRRYLQQRKIRDARQIEPRALYVADVGARQLQGPRVVMGHSGGSGDADVGQRGLHASCIQRRQVGRHAGEGQGLHGQSHGFVLLGQLTIPPGASAEDGPDDLIRSGVKTDFFGGARAHPWLYLRPVQVNRFSLVPQA